MKKIILSLVVVCSLVSCQDEYSFEGGNEDIYKKRPASKLNFVSNGGGEGTSSGESREVTTQTAPFDFGISAVLGVGALAAIRTARKRRKEELAAQNTNSPSL